jgi:HAD superfamily hydrolase (TIGR01509 family)
MDRTDRTHAWTPRPMPQRMPRAVVFDMDGLMLDSERLVRTLWQEVMARRGYALTDAIHATLIGRREPESDALLRAHFGAEFPLAEIRSEVQQSWYRRVHEHGIPRKPGLDPLLDFLEAGGIPKAIATSTARTQALICLGTLFGRFHATVCGDEVHEGKPAPDIYLRAAERLEVSPGDCLALEDSIAGVTAAERAGMTVIMVPDLIPPPEHVRHVSPSLVEVVAWLRNLQAGPIS